MSTPTEKQVEILSDLWLNFRSEPDFQDFIEYNDLGLPLAYAINSKTVPLTERAEGFINETFALLLAGMEIDEDTGFDDLNEIIDKFVDE
jgi:hypothetical protein